MPSFVKSFLILVMVVLASACSNSHLDLFPSLDDPTLMDKKIAPELLREDVQALYAGALARHPALAEYGDIEQIEQAVKTLQAQIDRPMNRLEFFRVVGKLSHHFNDGHSILIWPYQEYNLLRENGAKPFPFEVKVSEEGQLYLHRGYDSADSSLSAGARILSVNQQPADVLISLMQEYVGGESRYLREQIVAERFAVMLWAVFGFIDDFDIEVQVADKTQLVQVRANQEWRELNDEKAVDDEFYYQTLASGAGYLHIGHFDIDPDEFADFVDDAFLQIKQQGVRSLIIDLRSNTGGNTDTAEYLSRYVADKPFRMVSKFTEKLNQDNRGWFGYKGAPGEVKSHEWNDWIDPMDDDDVYKGEVYLLISPITYSAGIVFATTLKDNGFAVLVGQTTGGNANQTAQGNLFNLPHSQLRAYITTRMLVRPNGSVAAGGVKPHYIVTPTPETASEQRDMAVEKVLSLISQKRK